MKESLFMNAGEVAAACQVSVSKAYGIIRAMNAELSARGFLVIPGKVSRAYFTEKVYGSARAADDMKGIA